jgi:hypothetical protein
VFDVRAGLPLIEPRESFLRHTAPKKQICANIFRAFRFFMPRLEVRWRLDGVLQPLGTFPAGSGKTTTVYACLRHLAAESGGGRCSVSLEDPIETAIPGVAQSQINPAAGFDLATGLRSLMRQDPEMVMVGEIRDRPTAETAFQAALTGQLVLSTFQPTARPPPSAGWRTWGSSPTCCAAARWRSSASDWSAGFAIASAPRPTKPSGSACKCAKLGSPRAARRAPDPAIAAAPCWPRAVAAVEAGVTSPAEVRRVLGFG